MQRCVVISGCSGGGKSTLLAELARRGHATVEEPGRRIVKQELVSGGSALPWENIEAFLHRALAVARDDRLGCSDGLTFFDRGLVDAALGLAHVTGASATALLGECPRYDLLVFLAPPWPEIYVADAERRHGFDEAAAEYERLLLAFPRLGYGVAILPKTSVAARADFVLAALDGPTGVNPASSNGSAGATRRPALRVGAASERQQFALVGELHVADVHPRAQADA